MVINMITKGEMSMLSNLKAEMKRHGLRNTDIARELKISERKVRMATFGMTSLRFSEAEKLRDAFFPSQRLEYLFKDDGETLEDEEENDDY
jgi:predicted transcriptional regulator